MPSASYQEKSLYGTLAADLIVYVPYFLYELGHRATLAHIVGTVVILIIVQIILQSIIAIVSRSRLTDERDRTIQLRGYRAGYIALVSLVLLGLVGLWLHTAAGQIGQLNSNSLAIHFISALFCLIVCADIIRVASQLVAYRRSI